MRNFFHIARNTFRECLREPIYVILLLTAVYLIMLFPSLTLYVFREQIKLVTDSAMATTLVFGLVAAVFCSSSTITREMNNGTALLLLSKPVHRWTFVLSKMGGIFAALTVFVFICNLATLVALSVAKDQFRIDWLPYILFVSTVKLCIIWGFVRNFFYDKPISASICYALRVGMPILLVLILIVNTWRKVPGIHTEVIPALILLFFAVWAMGAITIMLSAKLNMIANLIISALLFFLGLVSDYFLANSVGTFSFQAVLYAIIPNWQFFWLADALSNKQTIPLSYVGWAGVYIVFYISLCSVIAVTLFSDKEVAENVK